MNGKWNLWEVVQPGHPDARRVAGYRSDTPGASVVHVGTKDECARYAINCNIGAVEQGHPLRYAALPQVPPGTRWPDDDLTLVRTAFEQIADRPGVGPEGAMAFIIEHATRLYAATVPPASDGGED